MVQASFQRTTASRNTRDKGGFTLTEVMIASVVMVVAITGALGALQHTFRLMDNARNTSLAGQIMQSEIERLRLKSWTDITTTIPTNGTVDVATIFNNDPVIANRFTVTRTVDGVPGRESTMKQITLEVKWKGTDGIEHTRSFRTYYSKNGLYDFYYTVAKS